MNAVLAPELLPGVTEPPAVALTISDVPEPDVLLRLLLDLRSVGGTLRVATDPSRVDEVAAVLEPMVDGLEPAPDVEIVADAIDHVAAPGDFVVADAVRLPALIDRGCVPLDDPVLPTAARSATGRLAAAIGWTRLEWIAECRMGSGYADEARMFLTALDDAGLEPALTGYPNPAARVPLGSETERLLRRCESRYAPPAHSVAVWHEKPIDPDLLEGRHWRVCRTMFETDSLPGDWVEMLNRYDRVWVPTAFNVETFQRAGVRPELLGILPETIDLERFNAQAPPRPIAGAEGFTFLSNFTFQERKGWRELLTAYVREFAGEEGVTLALKLSTGFVEAREIRAQVGHFVAGLGVPARRRPRIVVFDEELSDLEMAGLYTAADAYVSPTRGEGWGRPLMEALACGCPTIASRWSGQTAFLDDGCAWLIDGDVVPVPDDIDNETFRGQRWFAPDLDALQSAMRAVVDDPAGARARALSARPRLEADFGLAVIAQRIAELTLEVIACR